MGTVQVIFRGGEYDGFSLEEQRRFLNVGDKVTIYKDITKYKFENVIKMSEDYRNGRFESALQER
jgi:hypothetical protein